jgi:glycosyltransferase involved in cell wall biosynthesis
MESGCDFHFRKIAAEFAEGFPLMTTNTLSISVVVPVYNGAQSIADCIESLLKQDYPDFEVIIVNNNSTDNTVSIVETYPVRLVFCAERGPAPARNAGIEASTADIIAFTDADCIAESNWLSELVKPYANPEIGGSGGAIQAYQHDHLTMVEAFSVEHSPLVNFMSGDHEFLPHLYTANASYRRSILTQTGGFNPHLVTAEDVDLAWRAQLETGTKVEFAPNAVIYHHHRETQQGLARQQRNYGFGEILLDTMYGKYPGYPRNLTFQIRCLASQIKSIAIYLAAMVVRRWRRWRGRASDYDVAVPGFRFVIESNNVIGKLKALKATGLMRNTNGILRQGDRAALISQLYSSRKE